MTTQRKSKKANKKNDGFFQVHFDSLDDDPLPSASTSSPTVISVEELSSDKRRIRQRSIGIQPPSPEKNVPDNYDLHIDWDLGEQSIVGAEDEADGYQSDEEQELDPRLGGGVIELQEPARKRYYGADNPFVQLRDKANIILEEMMRLEGRGASNPTCGSCGGSEDVAFRCRTCCDEAMYCQDCIVDRHRDRPLDRVEMWNGSFFETKTLKSLGLIFQLAHPSKVVCGFPRRCREGFVVVDVDYIQEVNIQFCMCQERTVIGDYFQQLMRRSLFAATVEEPHTAFTFRSLAFFHTLTLTGKVSNYDFYNTIERRTNGAGLLGTKARHDELVRVMRIWRYIKMLKRAGVGVDPARSINNVSAGELAVRCIACPRPGINVPEDWQTKIREDPDKSFLYNKFISVDACFRLKRRNVSSEKQDPGLFTGKAYFVAQSDYQSHMEVMKTKPEQEEEGHCLGNRLAAIAQANNKFSKGYAQTGCILCICARHEVVEPNGTVDLNKGERYWHTDYAISASQQHSDPRLKRVLSYDICCQYHKRFFARLEDIPDSVRIEIDPDRWDFAVPKLHIKGHGRACQENFALHLLPGAGQTDGEGIERQWASLGPIGVSTREMGPGNRRETIDDHLSNWNWQKIISLGFVLRKRRQEARLQVQVQGDFFREFCDAQEVNVGEWSTMVHDWETRAHGDTSTVNPYSRTVPVTTEQDVRLRYAQDEAKIIREDILLLSTVSPSEFIMLGLQIEEQQRRLALDVKGDSFETNNQQLTLLDNRAKILRALSKFRSVQRIDTPAVAAIISNLPEPNPSTPPVLAEHINLYLPSALPLSERNRPEMSRWIAMETDFRRGQLAGALEEIRTHLFLQTRLHSQRSLHVRHQKESTRARQVLARNKRKLQENELKFRAAWTALDCLVGRDHIGYRELKPEDVRSYSDADVDPFKSARKVTSKRKRDQEDRLLAAGESRRSLSWIWLGVDTGENSGEMLEAVRIEWCKAQARQRRWSEELALVEEEMGRTLLALEQQASEWITRAPQTSGLANEAAHAYCLQQASIRRGLSAKFSALWALPDQPPRKRGPRVAEILPIDVTDSSDSDSDY
ncbi:hypothetical protein V5O48_014951 [Marasmius crinis-equi]|uniref:CxC2-like cysteine cluster KDZ transposase-associated domain-containing protein n=1 Tax=Marasmius crinis-equi TaxID=585013 RepID=A0ABR3EVW7_9AGAR